MSLSVSTLFEPPPTEHRSTDRADDPSMTRWYLLVEFLERLRGPHRGAIKEHPDLEGLQPNAPVWLFATPWDRTRKTAAHYWSGPWTILEYCGANNYTVLPHPSWKGVRDHLAHVSALRLFTLPPHLPPTFTLPPEEHFFLDLPGPQRPALQDLGQHNNQPSPKRVKRAYGPALKGSEKEQALALDGGFRWDLTK